MPDIYFKSVPFSKEDVTLALESGVDGIITEAEHVEGVRSLALCDVRAEADMPSVGLGSKAEEESIASRIAGGERLVLAQGWEIIPVENEQAFQAARAVAKNSDVILLDEPSSALDPIAEYKMFETMAGLCKNKDVLSVIVSHRLSSAAVCEKIFVFDKGKLAEQGTHKKLLENGGVYAEMFKKQAQNYLTEAAHE